MGSDSIDGQFLVQYKSASTFPYLIRTMYLPKWVVHKSVYRNVYIDVFN